MSVGLGESAMTPSPERAGSRPSKRRKQPLFKRPDGPAWIQALTAVAAVILTGVGLVFTGIGIFGTKAPNPTPIVITPTASISRVTVGEAEVSAAGSFENLDLDSEVVLFVGRPESGGDRPWVPVEAQIEARPVPTAAQVRASGIWNAVRPFTETGVFTWQALVVPAGSGAADAYADIKLHGPDSDLVIASSEVYRTGQ
jgi:hypothetical protein